MTAYTKASTLDEALAALEADAEARPVAGGTDLVVGVRQGKRELPGSLVGIQAVDELRALEVDPQGTLVIGALVSHDELTDSPIVRERATAVADAAGIIGSPATRHVGTLGGNLANASPAADTVAPLIVLGGMVEVRSTGGVRHVPAGELAVGPSRTSLAPGELVCAVRLPGPPPSTGSAYVRLEYRRAMEIAVVGAAARLVLAGDGSIAEAAVALTAVAPTIVRAPSVEAALLGRSASDAAALAAAAAEAVNDASPISDVRGSAEYRRATVVVIVRRALEIAARRAAGEAVPVPATLYLSR